MTTIDPKHRLFTGQEAEELVLKHHPTRAQIDRINTAIEAWAERDPMGYSEYEARRIDERIDQILDTHVIYVDELADIEWAIEDVDAGGHQEIEVDDECYLLDDKAVREPRYCRFVCGTCSLRSVEIPDITYVIDWHAQGGERTLADSYDFTVTVSVGGENELDPGVWEILDCDGEVITPREVVHQVGNDIEDSVAWEHDVKQHLPTMPETEDIDTDWDTDMDTIELSRDHGSDVRFTGEKIASASSKHYEGPRSTRWTELTLYRTTGGKWVCSEVGRTLWVGERDRYSLHIADNEAELIESLGHGRLAKELYNEAGIDHAEEID